MSIQLQNEYENLITDEYKSIVSVVSKAAEDFGVKIYLIGGIVRDLILKTPIKDIDITVEGDAIDFCKYLETATDCKIIAFQKELRTTKVEFPNGLIIDFTSTRKEYYAQTGMMPISYNHGCKLKYDVKRRDFTINTLALSLTGEDKYSLIDYYNGFEDIQNKKIKVLHGRSFLDDPSRIVRAIKFQMRFGFNIEEKTMELMQKYLDDIDKTIPLERIKNEFKHYFYIKKPALYKNMLENKVYKLICDNPYTDFDETLIQNFSVKNYWFIYFSMLLVNLNEILKLNLTSEENKTIKEVKELLALSNLNENNKTEIYKTFINKKELTPIIYYIITKNKAVLDYINLYKKIEINIKGKDLIELGYKPSKKFTELFEKILSEKLDGNLNTKEDEINFAVKYLNDN